MRAALVGVALAVCTATPVRAESPQILYMLECQGCHLPDGSGAPPRVPALRDSVGRFLEVAGGREYLVRVPGSAQAPLDDTELAAVLNWIVHTFGPEPEGFMPYDAAEVARLRAQPLVDVERVRAALLERVAARPRRD